MSEINFKNLDTAIHGQVRLGIIAALYLDGPLDFTNLKKRLEVTDGCLGAHLQKLDEFKYISTKKRFIGKRPNSSYSISSKGKVAFSEYLQSMQQLIDKIRKFK